jgi:chromosomal replication initiation ATPase DnaA
LTYQLPLDLETADGFSRAHFITTDALQGVLDVILRPQDWLSPHAILLGPKGSGKTHIGHIFAHDLGGQFVTAEESFTLDPTQLAPTPYVVDDADQASEELLFHLNNHVQMSGQYLVLLTEKHPLAWDVKLPDLGSRLRAMRLISLPEPDEDLLSAILKKLFARRAISPSPDCLDYLARRMERSVGAAQKIVTDIEQYANGRPFNRALARDFFEQNEALRFNDPDDH